jgi:nucleotide-binding universal stress UspA family protein
MSPRTLLVHLDDGPRTATRLDVSIRLARDTGARLIGAYLVPTTEITPSLAALLPRDLVAQRMRETSGLQDAAERSFREAAARGGLDRIEWRAPAGDALQAAIAHGRACDLFLLSQRDPDDPAGAFTGELLRRTLLGIGRPLLVIPYAGAQATLAQRVLIATDGGREAARAIGDAMFLLERAKEVRVLLGAASEAEGVSGHEQTRRRLDEWLRDHGIEPVIERYDPESGDKGEWLLSRAADFGSDLIVMGGYGHPRMQEIVLGGMTQTLLRAMTVPVLMSH